MALIERLAGVGDGEDRKLPVNQFHAAMYEVAAGAITLQNLIDYFELDAGEQAELAWIVAQYNAQPNAAAKERYVELLRVVFVLAEDRVPGYQTTAQLQARLSAV